ncbi:MAG: nitrilase-related carbon-nitrogen hydrolase [Desulfobacterales bacterium]
MLNDLRIAVVVFHSQADSPTVNLERTVAWGQKAAAAGADLACFPELNISGYDISQGAHPQAEPVPGPTSRRLSEVADAFGITLVAGLIEKDVGERQTFASQLVILPGAAPQVYRKLHIPPPEIGRYSAGDHVPLFTTKGWRFGVQLCYDAHFPELSTCMALAGADLILMPHASPRGTPAGKLASWCRHLPARAFDNGVFVVAVNHVGANGRGLSFPGVAVAIGPSGEILAQSLSAEETMLCVDLKRRDLENIRGHRMRYFLAQRRADLFGSLMPPG